MELVNGGDLFSHLRSVQKLDYNSSVYIIKYIIKLLCSTDCIDI